MLNKFDSILENIINEYRIWMVQINEFTPRTKELVMSILRFQKMLLERCTNRKTFASYEVGLFGSDSLWVILFDIVCLCARSILEDFFSVKI